MDREALQTECRSSSDQVKAQGLTGRRKAGTSASGKEDQRGKSCLDVEVPEGQTNEWKWRNGP